MLDIQLQTLSLTNEEVQLNFPVLDCVFETPIANVSFVIRLPNGGRVEADFDKKALQKMKEAKLFKSTASFKLESDLKLVALSFVGLIALVFFLLKVVIPAGSEYFANHTPQKWANSLDNVLLPQLDQLFLGKTELSAQRQDELNTLFNKFGLEPYDIHFRKGKSLRANAFALAGNTLVFTDEIVEHMNNDMYLLAIGLHEVGHLKHRHLLRRLLRDSAAGILSIALIGDLAGGSETLAQLGFVLVSRDFSRSDESQADAHSLEVLHELGVSPLCMAEALGKLQEYYKNETVDSKIFNRLSTHPSTNDRIASVKARFPNAESCEIK